MYLVTLILAFLLASVPRAMAQSDQPLSFEEWPPSDDDANDEARAFTPIWEDEHEDAPHWTRFTNEALSLFGDHLKAGTQDISSFCPAYNHLNSRDRKRFWLQLVAAVAKYESGFDPAARLVERSMGIDPVTGKRVVSEGLLQLSYQDERTYRRILPPGVCDFDYQSDRRLPSRDPRRTILDAETNLTCGVWILDNQVRRFRRISLSSGAYWAVLKPGKRSLRGIQNITRALPFCRL